MGSSRLQVNRLCAAIVVDSVELPDHAGSRGGASMNCGADGKAYRMK